MKVFIVEADTWTARIPCHHKFEMAGESRDEVFRSVRNRWPEAYNIKIYEK